MNEKLIRRALALVGAASLCLACAAPVFAENGIDDRELKQVRLSANSDPRIVTTMYGPDVEEDGKVFLDHGTRASFTIETVFDVKDGTPYGGNGKASPLYMSGHIQTSPNSMSGTPGLPYILLGGDDQSMTYGKILPGTQVEAKAEFFDMRLSSEAAVRFFDDQPSQIIHPYLSGRVEWQVQCIVQATATLPLPPLSEGSFAGSFTSEEQFQEFDALVRQALEEQSAQLPQPAKVVFRTAEEWGDAATGSASGWPVDDIRQETRIAVCYGARLQTVEWEDGTIEQLPTTNAGGPFWLGQYVNTAASEWVLSTSASATRAVATTAGAAALGLGGGAAANALSAGLDGLPAPRRREGFADPDLPDETPDLPETDDPSVSVSFYRPFDDLVNTKGAAVDVQLTVNGGEGLRWNYLPAAICPGGLKAVLPAVVGSSNTATLVLNLTGSAMKEPHIPVFITVVAWAAGADGRLLKTTGTMELQLHRPGLEAERAADGGLKVTLYADGNLDGVAEKVALKPEQYTCTEEADGALLIEAKPPYKGSCRLAAPGQEG